MFFSPLHGFKLPFQFTFPYSDIVVAILSTILIIYGDVHSIKVQLTNLNKNLE